MSEPRYDFCLAVVRKRTQLGYILDRIFLFHTPSLPQSDTERRNWYKGMENRQGIVSQIDRCYISRRVHPYPPLESLIMIDDLYLWGIIPILTVLNENVCTRIIPRNFGRRDRVVEEYLLFQHNLGAWFARLCEELNKMGGGKYIITDTSQSEVSRYSL
jgi:hypothetical protein